MHSQWSLKANTFFLSNSCCIYFPLQSFLYLVNLLSSSQSVWQLLGRQSLANKSEYTLREMPTSIPVSVFLLLLFHTLQFFFVIHLRACLHFLFGLQTPPTHLFYFKRIQINPLTLRLIYVLHLTHCKFPHSFRFAPYPVHSCSKPLILLHRI